MQEVSREDQTYIPGDRLINADFFTYSDFTYMVYEYQKKSVVYCEAVKLDEEGKKISDIVQLDSSHIGFGGNSKIYSTITNENKSRLMVFKINSRNRSHFLITTLLFNDKLTLEKKSQFGINMDDRNDYLDDFNLDNDGDFIFTKFNRPASETVTDAFLAWKPALADTLTYTSLKTDKILLDELHLKVDNANKRYFLTSFYYKQKRGNIDGLYFYVWDKQSQQTVMENTVVLSDELRKEAKGEANIKTAFNDYFIRNIIIKKDGGFIINTEAYYTTSRYGNWNRWNYMYGMPLTSYDYYSAYSPIYNNWYWRSRYDNVQPVRYHADNITILSFDKDGKAEWNSVIHKEQFDDETDDRVSFEIANTGNQIHFLFNIDEKRALLLNDFTLSPDGHINHNPTLKNLDRGYEFLPKYGKQVSSHQLLVPCYYRNYICFAKIDFNL